ncbi:hypothetical protein B0H34DRAFT_420019 [Crassisporium funariophilum]|nr:hypothetical protein B0H34DRAFT_420019 [Crassisporium funariophilum]
MPYGHTSTYLLHGLLILAIFCSISDPGLPHDEFLESSSITCFLTRLTPTSHSQAAVSHHLELHPPWTTSLPSIEEPFCLYVFIRLYRRMYLAFTIVSLCYDM